MRLLPREVVYRKRDEATYIIFIPVAQSWTSASGHMVTCAIVLEMVRASLVQGQVINWMTHPIT